MARQQLELPSNFYDGWQAAESECSPGRASLLRLGTPRSAYGGTWREIRPWRPELTNKFDARRGLCVFNVRQHHLASGLFVSKDRPSAPHLLLDLEDWLLDPVLKNALKRIESDVNEELRHEGASERLQLPKRLWIKPSPVCDEEEEEDSTDNEATPPPQKMKKAPVDTQHQQRPGNYWFVLTVYGLFCDKAERCRLSVGCLLLTRSSKKLADFLQRGRITPIIFKKEEEEEEEKEYTFYRPPPPPILGSTFRPFSLSELGQQPQPQQQQQQQQQQQRYVQADIPEQTTPHPLEALQHFVSNFNFEGPTERKKPRPKEAYIRKWRNSVPQMTRLSAADGSEAEAVGALSSMIYLN